ncbi:MAG: helix-turn-helix domain-containing protein [Bacteroidia bacterium]|nr:helix-turn-helix domain-containing protein [Bacteroidia bacterium]
MKIIHIIQRLQRIDCLIRTQSTGAPKEFAIKLQISESTLYETLNCFKELGAEIYFNRRRNSYCYKTPMK